MQSSHCYWTHEDQEYEVYYSFDEGGITDISLYPKNDDLLEKFEQEIIELVQEDIREEING